MKILIVSSSLNPKSRSQKLARELRAYWSGKGVSAELFDLRENELPFCDGGAAYGDSAVVEAKAAVEAADAFVFATPVYAYSVNAVLKNFIELVGRSMQDKVGGFLCAAGGSMGYMSVLGFANSLMLDYRMVILPRFVYATGSAWEGDQLNEEMRERLEAFANDFAGLAGKLVG